VNDNPELAAHKEEVEAWLAADPMARDDVDAQRHLQDLWHETTPVEPDAAAWDASHRALHRSRCRRPSRLPLGRVAALVFATAAAIWIAAIVFGPAREQKLPPDRADTAFAVATSDEIEILSVEAADTGSLVVGELPVRGPLELLGPGEVRVTSVAPADDNMTPEVREGPAAPIIWAHLDSEP
jgi:hypothetical protein